MLRNLSIISIMMMICEKKLGVKIVKKLINEYTSKNNSIVAFQRFWVFRHPNFFPPIIIIMEIMLKFRSTVHFKLSKYRYWNTFFFGQIWPFWSQRGQFHYLKWQNFFHGSSLLCKWGLSSKAHAIWPIQTCRNWYHIAQIGKNSFFGLGRG